MHLGVQQLHTAVWCQRPVIGLLPNPSLSLSETPYFTALKGSWRDGVARRAPFASKSGRWRYHKSAEFGTLIGAIGQYFIPGYLREGNPLGRDQRRENGITVPL
jgi:hypothetical protein